MALLRERIAGMEARAATQKQRLEHLQVTGTDPDTVHLASDLLEQMKISVALMQDALRILEDPSGRAAAFGFTTPIDDGLVNPNDPRSIEHWASRLEVSRDLLLELVREAGPSAHAIAKTLGKRQTTGAPRKAERR